jgi:hypothetical protein
MFFLNVHARIDKQIAELLDICRLKVCLIVNRMPVIENVTNLGLGTVF